MRKRTALKLNVAALVNGFLPEFICEEMFCALPSRLSFSSSETTGRFSSSFSFMSASVVSAIDVTMVSFFGLGFACEKAWEVTKAVITSKRIRGVIFIIISCLNKGARYYLYGYKNPLLI